MVHLCHVLYKGGYFYGYIEGIEHFYLLSQCVDDILNAINRQCQDNIQCYNIKCKDKYTKWNTTYVV